MLLENEPMKDTIVIFFLKGFNAQECVYKKLCFGLFIVLHAVVSAHIVHTLALLFILW